MTPLQSQLQRLYLSQPATGADGNVRSMVLELARPADWNAMSQVWRGIQADLNLPAPAIAVNGEDGYQLWFSLAQAVPASEALAFLEALRARYLPAIAPARVASMSHMPSPVDELQVATQRWASFVTPDLAAIFGDEPWLDLPPNAEAQAQVLSQLVCMKPEAFASAVAQLLAQPQPLPVAQHGVSPITQPAAVAGDGSHNPKRFLLDVMSDSRVELHLRIEAAKALLPYCNN